MSSNVVLRLDWPSHKIMPDGMPIRTEGYGPIMTALPALDGQGLMT